MKDCLTVTNWSNMWGVCEHGDGLSAGCSIAGVEQKIFQILHICSRINVSALFVTKLNFTGKASGSKTHKCTHLVYKTCRSQAPKVAMPRNRSSPWEANSRSVSIYVTGISWNLKVHYTAYKRLQLDIILSHTHPANSFPHTSPVLIFISAYIHAEISMSLPSLRFYH
jgi:hypothetical protein